MFVYQNLNMDGPQLRTKVWLFSLEKSVTIEPNVQNVWKRLYDAQSSARMSFIVKAYDNFDFTSTQITVITNSKYIKMDHKLPKSISFR